MLNSEIGGAVSSLEPTGLMPRHTELPQATLGALPIKHVPATSPLGGQFTCETQLHPAAQSASDEGHLKRDARAFAALVGNLAMETRRYVDLRRAHQRLDLQAKAMARYSCDGDKAEGAKLHAKAMKDAAHPLRIWLQPYLDAMAPLEAAIDKQAKLIDDLAKGLPVADWCKAISGLSFRFLGLVVGECGVGPGEFRNPSCLWKRMGMAVIDGGRQRRVLGDAAVEHGYVARRRALMWNIGESIIKQQVRKDPDDDEARVGVGPYGALYLERKVYELTKTDKPIIAHSRAKRYMEKRLLRELWKAWRLTALQAAASSGVEG